MAASISASPGEIIAPAFSGRLFYTLTGYVPASQYKYRYVIDVYVDGTQIARLLKAPDVGSNDATFNLASVMRGQLSGDPQGGSGYPIFNHPEDYSAGDLFDLPGAGTECVKVEVKVGESFASTATGEPSITANQDTETIYLFNGSIQLINDSTIASAFYHTSATSRLLSNRSPSTYYWQQAPSGITSADVVIPIWEDGYHTLSFINDDGTFASGSVATQVLYALYDNSFALVGSVQRAPINATLGAAAPGGATAANQKIVRIGAGPGNLNEVTDPTISNPPSGTTNWSYYIIRLEDASNNPVSRNYVFVNRNRAASKLLIGCNKNDRYGLAWFNARGGWDYFDAFDRVAVKNWKFDRKFWRRAQLEQEDSWETNHRQSSQVVTQKAITIRSRYLQGGEFRLLRFAMHSPHVYLIQYDASPSFIPVNITASDYVERDVNVGKVYDLTLNLEWASLELVQ
jgi:hypothetical protein